MFQMSAEDDSPTSSLKTDCDTPSKKIFEYVKLPSSDNDNSSDNEYDNDNSSDNEYDYDSSSGSNDDDKSESEHPTSTSFNPHDVKSKPCDENDEGPKYKKTSKSGIETCNTKIYDFDAEHHNVVQQSKYTINTRLLAKKHEDLDKKSCSFYKEINIGKDVLEPHMKKHAGTEKPFNCTECGMSFKYMSVLRVHMRKHTGEKPFRCSLCDKTFCQKAYLDAHLKRHSGDKLYFCDECNKAFITQAHLKRHLVTHIQGKTFICTECGEEGPSETCQSEQHSRSYFEDRPFVCQICDKRFSMHSAMINHSRTHTGEKPFSCELCQKTFTQRSNLSVHMKTHTGEKKFKCQFCNIAYLYKVNLDRHIQRAHGENSSYTCKECGESFSWRSSLHLHMLSHTGKEPFQCDYCDKKYVLQKCLWVHMRTHSGTVDFTCKVCDEHFKHHSELRKHEKTHKSKKSQILVKEGIPINTSKGNNALRDNQSNKSNESSDLVQNTHPSISYQNVNNDDPVPPPNISLFQNENPILSIQKVEPDNSFYHEKVDVLNMKPKSNISYYSKDAYLQMDHSQISKKDFCSSFEKH